MSVYSPDKQIKENSHHVHLYGASNRYIGVAWLCSLDMYMYVKLFPTGLPTHMAVLSGPDDQESLARTLDVWPEEKYEKKKEREKFYR